MSWTPSTNYNSSRNYNTGFLSKDPTEYLYMDIDDAKSGNKKWISYDEMRNEASGIKYDCFTDETCYGYGWDYDMEHYIPALKEYANAEFYNDDMGIVDFYTMFAHEASFGDWPDFEDDEWWDYHNEIVKDGETEYCYLDPITDTKEFKEALFYALYTDSDLEDEFPDTTDYTFEDICQMTVDDVCDSGYAILLRNPNFKAWYAVQVGDNRYYVDGDLIWDTARSFCKE